MNIKSIIDDLNNKEKNTRLYNLKQLKQMIDSGSIEKPATGNDVNNHIHTTFSFSPYSPTKAIWMAYTSGLETAGIVDHDSLGGAEEFIAAGKILNIGTTIGFECRADFHETELEGRKINHPDQKSVAYMCIHGVPHRMINSVQDYLKPYRELRNIRNRKMTDNINEIIGIDDVRLSFDEDIIPLSECENGGSITERHILFALSKKIVLLYGKGTRTTEFLEKKLGLPVMGRFIDYLTDSDNPFYDYDLLGLLKGSLVEKIYIDADAECPPVRELLDFAHNIGGIPSYAYLGDIKDSVTGDKKDQKFEDEYIELLFDSLKKLGFSAVTYMPARNTAEQLNRIRKLCIEHELFQISGEDINSPRQEFICAAQRKPEFRNLYDAAWALIGHETITGKKIDDGLFSVKTVSKYPNLNDRIKYFSETGKMEIIEDTI